MTEPKKRRAPERAVKLPPLPRLPKLAHPSIAGRNADGTLRPGTAIALTDGLFARRESLPPDRQLLIADIDGFRAGLIADQGGESELTTLRGAYVERLVQVELLLRLLAAALRDHGIWSRRGQLVFTQFMAATERFDRLARVLGLERRAREVLETPVQWLARQGRDRAESEAQADVTGDVPGTNGGDSQ